MNSEYAMPLYLQLKDSIKAKIDNGEFARGSRIPSEREMAAMYGINRMTIRKTIKLLIDEGELISVQGRGTYVAEKKNKIELGMNSSTRLSLDIRMGGMNPRKEIISFKRIKLPNILTDMFVHDEFCYELIRLLYANDEPYALQKAYIPYHCFEDAERYDFRDGSLYDYMDVKGKLPKRIETTLKVDEVNSKIANYLNVDSDDYVFLFEYRGYDETEELVEFTISYNRPENTSYHYVSMR